MPKGLKRYYGSGDLHFITWSCYQRRPLLGSKRARNLFVKILGEVRERYGFALVGYVVMPEHIHLLISEPKRGTPSTALQVLKQRVSRGLLAKGRKRVCAPQLRVWPQEGNRKEMHFWQRRFYDFNVWSEEKKREKLEYMHGNPVERGLVSRPDLWRWSSYRFYESGEASPLRVDPV